MLPESQLHFREMHLQCGQWFVTPLTDEEVTQEYLDQMSAVVYDKFSVSEMVLHENYYQYLDGHISFKSDEKSN